MYFFNERILSMSFQLYLIKISLTPIDRLGQQKERRVIAESRRNILKFSATWYLTL
jgi:hypothetical protein